MYNDEDMGQAYKEGYEQGKADGGYAVLSEVKVFLENSRRPHYYCEDSWYSCPKAPEGCSDENQGDGCNCGTDQYNAELDIILNRLGGHFG